MYQFHQAILQSCNPGSNPPKPPGPTPSRVYPYRTRLNPRRPERERTKRKEKSPLAPPQPTNHHSPTSSVRLPTLCADATLPAVARSAASLRLRRPPHAARRRCPLGARSLRRFPPRARSAAALPTPTRRAALPTWRPPHLHNPTRRHTVHNCPQQRPAPPPPAPPTEPQPCSPSSDPLQSLNHWQSRLFLLKTYWNVWFLILWKAGKNQSKSSETDLLANLVMIDNTPLFFNYVA